MQLKGKDYLALESLNHFIKQESLLNQQKELIQKIQLVNQCIIIEINSQFLIEKLSSSFLKLQLSMNSLHAKIQQVDLFVSKAASLFQSHDFKKSLQLYEQSISICRKNQEPKALLYNLISSKGALMSILGDQKGALDTLNEVLNQDPYHALCLMRRSQVYKKKNKLNKALKDLKLLGSFSPDNLQIAAMKIEVQNLKIKCKQVNSSSSESEKSQQSDDIDQEQKLNFSNLIKIDRKSVSIMIKPNVPRKSRVTIGGDIAIEYDAIDSDEKDDKSFASTNVSKQYAKEKFIKTFRQIQLDDEDQNTASDKSIEILVPSIKPVTPRGKSILKNRNSTIYINNEKSVEKKKYGGRQSKMIDLLKNIDGKVITNTCSERSSKQIREVEFRKSIFRVNDQIKSLSLESTNQSINSNVKTKSVRKSCLKRSSFDLPKEELKGPSSQTPRRSKFDMMSKNSIDGLVINNKRRQAEDEGHKQNINNDSDSDEGSEHNIFGDNQIVLSKQIRDNLGLGEDSNQVVREKKEQKLRATGGKSILKKDSILMKSVEKTKEASPLKDMNKAKKSVMFTKFE